MSQREKSMLKVLGVFIVIYVLYLIVF